MFKRVEVTFKNKEGVEETAQGKLLTWFWEGDGWLIAYIVLDDGRFVEGTDEYTGNITYVEMTHTTGVPDVDVNAPGYEKYHKRSYEQFLAQPRLKLID